MSKKKSKKKANKKYKSYFESQFSKSSAKKGGKKVKSKTHAYDAPKTFKNIKPSLTKKDAKEAKKVVLSPVDVPKEFRKLRTRCNHAGSVISVSEFKEMTPAYAAYTPMLDAAVNSYGEDSISVCKICYDVLVDPARISSEGMQEALLLLYLSANAILSRKRLKGDEIKEISKLRDGLGEWDHALAILRKLEDSGALTDTGSGTLSQSDLAQLSKADRISPA